MISDISVGLSYTDPPTGRDGGAGGAGGTGGPDDGGPEVIGEAGVRGDACGEIFGGVEERELLRMLMPTALLAMCSTTRISHSLMPSRSISRFASRASASERFDSRRLSKYSP